MIKIKSVHNDGEVHRYVFESSYEVHNELINFFNRLDFPSEELAKLDVIFPESDGLHLYLVNDAMKVHIFVCGNNINMVIDTEINQSDLTDKMKSDFIFPGNDGMLKD